MTAPLIPAELREFNRGAGIPTWGSSGWKGPDTCKRQFWQTFLETAWANPAPPVSKTAPVVLLNGHAHDNDSASTAPVPPAGSGDINLHIT